MYVGMVDIVVFIGNEVYVKVIDCIWEDVIGKKLYVMGGIGFMGENEGFLEDYYLFNVDVYCEICVLIVNIFWNYRFFFMYGQVKYIDVLEKILYNVLSLGLFFFGDCFFYLNVLEVNKD